MTRKLSENKNGRALLQPAMKIMGFIMAAYVAATFLAANSAFAQSPPLPEPVRVDIGGRVLSMVQMGEGSPTIVIESGMGEPGLSSGLWKDVAESVSKTHRVVLYDRAGLGESAVANKLPRTCADVAADLDNMLANAKVPGPYLLVGHSFGGLHARVFCDMYPDKVVGLVLVDASHPDQDAAWLNELPKETNDEPSWARETRTFFASRNQPSNNPENLDGIKCAAEARNAKPLEEKPLVVLTHSPQFKLSPDLPDDVASRMETVSASLQKDFLKLSRKSVLHVSQIGGHQLHVEDPDLVVQGIQEAVAMATGAPAPKQTSKQAAITPETLDNYFNYLLSHGKFNGCALVAHNDEVILKKGYGFRDAEKKLPNLDDTAFRIYSATKPFTSSLVLKLVQLEKLSLNQPVSQLLPDLALDGEITLEHLLSHTSGLPDYSHTLGLLGSDLDALKQFLATSPRAFNPGEGWQYSNTNYALLGHAIHKVLGDPYEKVMHDRILSPLHMENSGFDYEKLNADKKAIGYCYVSQSNALTAKDLNADVTFAAGGLYSTVADLFTFTQGVRSYRFLPKETLNDAWKPVPKSPGYGLGWITANRPGVGETVFHSGGAPGFSSQICFTPDGKWTVILLCNTEHVNVYKITEDLFHIFSGREIELPKEKAFSATKLENLVGVYHSSLPRQMTICTRILDGRLAVSMPGHAAETLIATGDSFYHMERKGRIAFVCDRAGKASSMKITEGFLTVTLNRSQGDWGIVGSATPDGWEGKNDIPLRQAEPTGLYTAHNVKLSSGEIKFRHDNQWAVNFGDNDGDGVLEQDGANLAVKAGVYNVVLDLRPLAGPTYSLTEVK